MAIGVFEKLRKIVEEIEKKPEVELAFIDWADEKNRAIFVDISTSTVPAMRAVEELLRSKLEEEARTWNPNIKIHFIIPPKTPQD